MLVIVFTLLSLWCGCITGESMVDAELYLAHIENMFDLGFNSYMDHAWPLDELCPITCRGKDTWGSFQLTLVDSLDSLWIMGKHERFLQSIEVLPTSFDIDQNVSLFETNIRILGGLLSAYVLSEEQHPRLLELAVDLGERLILAFETPSGMPYGTVNLRNGVPPGETPVTCTACIGTYSLEFGVLSRLTGDSKYDLAARRALAALFAIRTPLGLFGNHVNVSSSKFTHNDCGIGGSVDSLYEYMFKAAILFNDEWYLDMFEESHGAVSRYLKAGPWYIDVDSRNGQTTWPLFSTLQGFWPGLQATYGHRLREAKETISAFMGVWNYVGVTPEGFNLVKSRVEQGRAGYPLRPEIIESLYHLYKRTSDPQLLEYAADIIYSIEFIARVECGYATIADVDSRRLDDRMESFFLSETLKYAYLLFDSAVNGVNASSITRKPHIFTTEGHPFPMERFASIDTPYNIPLSLPKHSVDVMSPVTAISGISLNFDKRSVPEPPKEPPQKGDGASAATPLVIDVRFIEALRLLGIVNRGGGEMDNLPQLLMALLNQQKAVSKLAEE